MNEQLLYNELYEKTKDFGRTQFVRLLMEKERENQQLKEKLERVEKANKDAIEYINKTEYSDIVGINSNSVKDFWFIKELLDILDTDKGE